MKINVLILCPVQKQILFESSTTPFSFIINEEKHVLDKLLQQFAQINSRCKSNIDFLDTISIPYISENVTYVVHLAPNEYNQLVAQYMSVSYQQAVFQNVHLQKVFEIVQLLKYISIVDAKALEFNKQNIESKPQLNQQPKLKELTLTELKPLATQRSLVCAFVHKAKATREFQEFNPVVTAYRVLQNDLVFFTFSTKDQYTKAWNHSGQVKKFDGDFQSYKVVRIFDFSAEMHAQAQSNAGSYVATPAPPVIDIQTVPQHLEAEVLNFTSTTEQANILKQCAQKHLKKAVKQMTEPLPSKTVLAHSQKFIHELKLESKYQLKDEVTQQLFDLGFYNMPDVTNSIIELQKQTLSIQNPKQLTRTVIKEINMDDAAETIVQRDIKELNKTVNNSEVVGLIQEIKNIEFMDRKNELIKEILQKIRAM
ncbi:Hypothetical_protein [Hexamita inflata]|uniref:Hypothetical_protein n=1 Tax=Hexamita inflata TaxID=28002 RepID=A0AA86QMQ4_9EUKA|nr:Hypothetical protein HINF_LOCUS46256 [Hexamita inflata]